MEATTITNYNCYNRPT